MRKFLFLFLLFYSANSFAQKTFHAGIIAGVNGNQIHGDTYSGFNEAGIVSGIYVCTNPLENWYFQMEMQYSMKGSRKIPHPDRGDYSSFQVRLNYIEIPFIARKNFRKFYFEFGQTFGVLANVREWDANGEISPVGYRHWESAFILGAGININEHLYFDFRYTNSIFAVKVFPTPVYYQNYFLNLFNKGMYNNVVGLTACYRFIKKEKNE